MDITPLTHGPFPEWIAPVHNHPHCLLLQSRVQPGTRSLPESCGPGLLSFLQPHSTWAKLPPSSHLPSFRLPQGVQRDRTVPSRPVIVSKAVSFRRTHILLCVVDFARQLCYGHLSPDNFLFVFKSRSHYVFQTGLEFVVWPRLPQTHGNPSASASRVLVLQQAPPCRWYLSHTLRWFTRKYKVSAIIATLAESGYKVLLVFQLFCTFEFFLIKVF